MQGTFSTRTRGVNNRANVEDEMGLRIDREGSGYRIRLSEDRTKIIARNYAEIVQAIKHYYGERAHGERETCPLCRAVMAQGDKRKRIG